MGFLYGRYYVQIVDDIVSKCKWKKKRKKYSTSSDGGGAATRTSEASELEAMLPKSVEIIHAKGRKFKSWINLKNIRTRRRWLNTPFNTFEQEILL